MLLLHCPSLVINKKKRLISRKVRAEIQPKAKESKARLCFFAPSFSLREIFTSEAKFKMEPDAIKR
jgi:hypothetical protein